MPEHAPIQALVVIPTYNEAAEIQRLCQALSELPAVAQILVVDDASPDGTADLAEALAPTHPVAVLRRTCKDGRGGAVLVRHATREQVRQVVSSLHSSIRTTFGYPAR